MSDSESPNKEEGVEDPSGMPMVGDPANTFCLDVIFGATSIGMRMEVESPVKIISKWGVISNDQEDIKSIQFEIWNKHDGKKIVIQEKEGREP